MYIYLIMNKIFIINKDLYNNMDEDLIGKYAIYVDGAGYFSKCYGYIIMDIYSKNPLDFKEIIILTESKNLQVRNNLDLSYSLRTCSKLNSINHLKNFYYYINRTDLYECFQIIKENYYISKINNLKLNEIIT